KLQDLLDEGAVLGLERARLDRRRRLVGPILDFDVEVAGAARLGRTDYGAVESRERRDLGAAGHAAALDDLGDGADLRVHALVARHEENARFIPGVDGEGGSHVREDDGVVQRDEQVFLHYGFTLLS